MAFNFSLSSNSLKYLCKRLVVNGKSLHNLHLNNYSTCRKKFLFSQSSSHILQSNKDMLIRLYTSAANSSELQREWDIVISGGGLVGSAMACALGNSPVLEGKKILLLESGSHSRLSKPLEKYSNRVVSLNPGTRDFFNSFGAWENICNKRMIPVKKLQVWEACSDSMISFQQPGMVEDVSYIVENDVILESLSEIVETMDDRITVWYETKVVNYKLPKSVPKISEPDSELSAIVLKDGTELRTKLLIGADGKGSLVRKTMDIKTISWKYDQKAIVATLKLSEPTDNCVAWQRFLPNGPIALLPLTNDQSSLVWTTTPEMADELLKASEEEFIDALNCALWDETQKNSIVDSVLSTFNGICSTIWPEKGTIRQLPPSILSLEKGSRTSFPLSLGHSTKYVAPRVALVGDSAHSVHPLAGLGVNLGFGDVKCLAELLSESVYKGNEIGLIDPLLDYETERQRYVVPVMAAIDGLNRLYSTDLTPIVLLRSLGLNFANSLEFLKARIINQASN